MKSNDQIHGASIDAPMVCDETNRRRPPDITAGVLWVVIPYTTPELTRAAIRHANASSHIDVHVALVDIQVVPFPCPLDQPPINSEYSQHRLRQLFNESGLPGCTAVYYTRDWLDGFRQALEPMSVVIMATKIRLWPTREKRLARALSKAGYQVVLLPVS